MTSIRTEDDFERLNYLNVLQDPHLLFQRMLWVDKFGFCRIIKSMDPDHCGNTVRWMRRNADVILMRYLAERERELAVGSYSDARHAVMQGWGGEWFEWDAHPSFGNPEWLEHTPLVMGLRARAREGWPVAEMIAEAPLAV